MTDLTVTRDDDAQQYVGRLDGVDDPAIIAFRRRDDADPPVVRMTHTEVPESMRGQGVGQRLVAEALADVRQRGEVVQPDCPFVRRYIDEHPEVHDLRRR